MNEDFEEKPFSVTWTRSEEEVRRSRELLFGGDMDGVIEYDPEEKPKKYVIEILDEEANEWSGHRLESVTSTDVTIDSTEPIALEFHVGPEIYRKANTQKIEIVSLDDFHAATPYGDHDD